MKIKEQLFKLCAPTPAFIFFLAGFFALITSPNNYDFIWHLFLGRYITLHQIIPDTNIFYYTPSVFYGYNYAWLSQVFFYTLYNYWGVAALVFLNSFIGGIIFFFLYKIMERKNNNTLYNTCILLLVFKILLPYLMSFRPLVFTVLFFVLFLEILDRYHYQQNKSIYILPAIIAIWVNMHPGYLLGFLLILIYIVINIRQSRKLIIVFALSILAMLINPYFYRIFEFPIILLKSITMLQKVSEWGVYSKFDFAAFILLVLGCIGIFATTRFQLKRFLLFALFFILGLSIDRNVPFFAIISIIILRELHYDRLIKGKTKKLLDRFNLKSTYFQGWLMITVIISIIICFSYLPARKPMIKYNLDFSNYPVAGVESIKRINPPGNILSSEIWSGYILWELYPSYTVFYDAKGGFGGKQIEDFIEMMRPRAQWHIKLNEYNITTILLPKNKPLALLLEYSPQWRLVYSDTICDLFVKNLNN